MNRLFQSLVFLFLSSTMIYGQNLCEDKKTSIYFASNSFELTKNSKQDLDSIIAISKGNYFEVHGYADSTGRKDFNEKLSSNRSNQVVQYIIQSGAQTKDKIAEFYFGEREQKYSNLTESEKAKNRRVDLFSVPIDDNRVKIIGDRGSSLEIPYEKFKKNSLCDCEYELEELFSNREASENNIPMQLTGGGQLTTGGMFRLKENNCIDEDDFEGCFVKIRIPAPVLDREMGIWISKTDSNGNVTWEQDSSSIIFDSINNIYEALIPCRNWVGNDMLNVDKEIPSVVRPKLTRTTGTKIDGSFLYGDNLEDTVILLIRSDPRRINFRQLDTFPGRDAIVTDIGRDAVGDIYFLRDSLKRFVPFNSKVGKLPLSAYKKVIYSDTLTKLKCRKCKELSTSFPDLGFIAVSNEPNLLKSNLINRVFRTKKYMLPIPINQEFVLVVNKRKMNYNRKKKKYKTKKGYYKMKIRGY